MKNENFHFMQTLKSFPRHLLIAEPIVLEHACLVEQTALPSLFLEILTAFSPSRAPCVAQCHKTRQCTECRHHK